jgi:beta-N-acetylhexosaminidase
MDFQQTTFFKLFRSGSQVLLLLFLFLTTTVFAQQNEHGFIDWQKDKQCKAWVDSVYDALTLDERIAQFFMLPAHTAAGKDYNMDSVVKLIGEGKAGGVIFFKGNPTNQAQWTNKLQEVAKVKAMVAIDGEWGLSMRLDSTMIYPRQMALGAVKNNELIYTMGKHIAQQCKRMGIHVNFAPCVDVNNNPNNPVINERSFGEDKIKVSLKGIEYMRGMQDEGVLACAKHFPGHGDTETDSHHDLPVINKSLEQLQQLELFPFKQLIKNGVGSVMAAHLHLPQLDSSGAVASSLSKKVVTELLKEQMHFNGLVFSDALNMKGVSKFFAPGTVDSMAFMAGNDILVFSQDCRKGIEKIRMAIDSGVVSEKEFEHRVKKVLGYKYKMGLNNYAPIDVTALTNDLNSFEYQQTQESLYEQAVTIVANADSLLPLNTKEKVKKVAVLSVRAKRNTSIQNFLKQWMETDEFFVENDTDTKRFQTLFDTLSQYDVVVMSIHDMSRLPAKNYAVSKQTVDFYNRLTGSTKVILTLLGNAYALSNFQDARTAVVAYDDTDPAQRAAANAIMGAIRVNGKLPVTVGKFWEGTGFAIKQPVRLQMAKSASLGIDPLDLKDLEEEIYDGLISKTMPGCQLLVAHDNKVIWNRAYGNPTYESSAKVGTTDLYDVASLTKILSTTLAIMHLVDEQKIDLTKTVKDYLHLDEKATIGNIMLRNLLLHQSGTKAYIEFYKAFKDPYDYRQFFSQSRDSVFNITVADKVFMRGDYRDSMWNIMAHYPIDPKPKYVYSDLNFYILQKIAETVSGKPLDEYVNETFYEPMGLTRIGYSPLNRFDVLRMMPTEIDTAFRKQTVTGYVHDPGAAMYGGVAGHAGIFSNAMDVAAVMQMLVNKGSYNGRQLLKPETIELFTRKISNVSRRGLGFDKPEPDDAKSNPCSENTPLSAFGHSGFTGTCTWADPDTKTVYVFLSNRVYPSAANNRLVKMNLRTKLQHIVYKAVRMHEIKD